jgi:hypothetical protein
MDLQIPEQFTLKDFPTGPMHEWNRTTRARMEAHARAFAAEYVKDFDPFQTVIRLGYEGDTKELTRISKLYMRNWMTQAFIQQLMDKFEAQNIATRDRLMAITYRDAANFSPHADPKARVAAQKNLMTLMGLDVKKKEVTHNAGSGLAAGGVMVIPGISPDEWERRAAESQAALKEEVRK